MGNQIMIKTKEKSLRNISIHIPAKHVFQPTLKTFFLMARGVAEIY